MNEINLNQLLIARSKLKDKGIVFVEQKDNEIFLSYFELFEKAKKALAFLQRQGVRPGDELVFQIEDNKDFVITFWACVLGGIIAVPLATGQTDDQKIKLFKIWPYLKRPYLICLSTYLKKLQTFGQEEFGVVCDEIIKKVINVQELYSEDSNAIIYSPAEDDVVLVQFSSGSTGNPKGIVLTHKNLIANMFAISEVSGYTEDDSMLSWMPLSHDMGLIGFHINPLFIGMKQYLIPTTVFVRRPLLWLDKASRHKVTILCSPNFGYKYFLKHYERAEGHALDLSSVRIIYNGAEPISESVCKAFIDRLGNSGLKSNAICPVYGLAEASLAVSISPPEDEVASISLNRTQLASGQPIRKADEDNAVSFVNVGRPIRNVQVRITHQHQTVNEGIIGLIEIKGRSVTSGYYNNAEKTTEVLDKKGWLSTGDLGFLLSGCLYVTGRSKDILFVNGLNFYAHDIEAQAQQVEGIDLNKVAAAGRFNHLLGKEEILLFVLHRSPLVDFIAIADRIKAMINLKMGFQPDKIIPVPEIPRTTSGKLQRFKLSEEYQRGAFDSIEAELNRLTFASYSELAGQDDEEFRILLEIWREVLENKTLTPEQNFFQSGGNSLLAAEVCSKIHDILNVDVPTYLLYENPSVSDLASALKNKEELNALNIEPAGGEDYFLSATQLGLYYLWQADRFSTSYNVPSAFRFNTVLDVNKLVFCINTLIERYESLRTYFLESPEPKFRIYKELQISVEPLECKAGNLDSLLRDSIAPFDLLNGPLFRFRLFCVNGESILFFDAHHIISDGKSVQILIKDLMALYFDTPLNPVNFHYQDYTNWKRLLPTNSQKRYWENVLSGELPVLDLPVDSPRRAMFDSTGKRVGFTLSKEVTANLVSLAKSNQVSLHCLLFSIYNLVLSEYTHQDDIIVGTPVTGRDRSEFREIFGLFVNSLPVRVRIDKRVSFPEFLKNTKRILNDAFRNQDYSFFDIVKSLNVKRDVSRNPIFDTMFVFQDMEMPTLNGLNVSRHFFDPGFSKYDLTMEVAVVDSKIKYSLEYPDSLFDDKSMINFSILFENLIRNVITHPGSPLVNLSLSNAAQVREYVYEFNETEHPGNGVDSVYSLFEQQAKINSGGIAIEFNDARITYARLKTEIESLASQFQAEGISKGDMVALLLPRSPEFIVSVLAVLKCGACYLPFDIGQPREMIRIRILDSQCRYLVSQKSIVRPLSLENWYRHHIIELDQQDKQPKPFETFEVYANDLAYILYTSGTTGKPKGVMIDHGALLNYCVWAATQYTDNLPMSFAFHTSVSFDLTVTSVFVPLITGGTIKVYGEENKQNSVLYDLIQENAVEVIKLTPSHLQLIKNNFSADRFLNSRIKTIIVGGENFKNDLADSIFKLFAGDVRIFNEYGPTESTVGCMIYEFKSPQRYDSVPIGIPIMNTQIYLLDERLNPVAKGVTGDIYVSGKGLARGYLFQEHLTKERFIDNPFVPGSRMYKTGDNARRLLSGDLLFGGRKDSQVKLRGHRIELSEIELHLDGHPEIQNAVIKFNSDPAYLCAYYVRESGSEINSIELTDYLSDKIPHYMIPSYFVEIKSIPLTANGKVNYDLLPHPVENKNRLNFTLSTENEKALMNSWKQVLGNKNISVDDSFFELGGDSIKAVQISSRLKTAGLVVKVKDILRYNTISKIAPHIVLSDVKEEFDQSTLAGQKDLSPIEKWYFSRGFKNLNHYNQSILLDIKVPIEMYSLQQAFEILISHHDGLRLNYDVSSRKLFYNNQLLQNSFVLEIFEENLTGKTLDLQELNAMWGNKINIENTLLIKVVLIKSFNGDRLFITAHHLAIDGVSWRILLEDLVNVLTFLKKREPITIPPKTASLRQWQLALNQFSADGNLSKERLFWEEIELTDFRLTTIKDADLMEGKAGCKMLQVDQGTTRVLMTEINHIYNTDMAIILNVSLALAIGEYFNIGTIVIEQENHGRHLDHVNVSRTIGWFTAMYPLKIEIPRGSIEDCIKSIKEQVKAIPNHGIGYGILKNLGLLSPDSNCQNQIRLNYLGQFDQEFDNDFFSLKGNNYGADIGRDNHLTTQLEMIAMISRGQLQIQFNYNNSVISQFAIEAIGNKVIEILTCISQLNNTPGSNIYTPSDFESIELNQEELDNLFN